MAVGTIVFTETTHGSVKKIRAAWTAGTAGEAGTASGTTTNAYNGKVISLITNPDDVLAPDDNYDLTVADADGDDVLGGAGLNRDTLNTEVVASASLGAVAGSRLTFAISGAGASEAGVAVLYIR
jgi:hypothetical protein